MPSGERLGLKNKLVCSCFVNLGWVETTEVSRTDPLVRSRGDLEGEAPFEGRGLLVLEHRVTDYDSR